MNKPTRSKKVTRHKPKPKARPKKAKKPAKRKKSLFNFVVNREERREIKRKAKQYTNGNASAWVKYASLKHVVPAKLRRREVPVFDQAEAAA